MTKKHFIALADHIRSINLLPNGVPKQDALFSWDHIEALADFCSSQNPHFARARWLDYIAGKCGPNGGKV